MPHATSPPRHGQRVAVRPRRALARLSRVCAPGLADISVQERREGERRVFTRVSSPSWSCLGVVGSSSLWCTRSTLKKNHDAQKRRLDLIQSLLTPCTPLPCPVPITEGRRERGRERRVFTRASSPSWSCLGVEGSSQLVVRPLNAQEEPQSLLVLKDRHIQWLLTPCTPAPLACSHRK